VRGLIVLFAVLTFASVNAQQSKWPTEKGKEQVKTLMHKFWAHVGALRKYAGDSTEFNNPKNEAFISEELKELSKLTKKAKHQSLLNSPNFTFSRKVLENHISEVERAFRMGNKDYARWMLNSTTSICMSCHTQFPDKAMGATLPDTGTGTTFSDAEFLFATRRFDAASGIYKKLIAGFPDNKLKVNDLETSLRRLVAFHARVKRDPKVGVEDMEEALKNKNIPEYLRRDVAAWKVLFDKWNTESDIDPKKVSPEELTKWVKKQFEKTLWDRMVPASDPRTVTYLRVSGILYEYLHYHPRTEITPKILYWLAKSEYRIGSNFFYSLGDLYLKDCMQKYSKDPIAKQCFFEYEKNLLLSYTGSRGTYVPPDVARELRELRALVGLKPGEKNKETDP